MTTTIVNGLYTDDLQLTIDEQGDGRPLLLLPGGGGPPSMGPLPLALSEQFWVIAPARYGRAYAPSFPNGRFEPIRKAGHLPHLEQPGTFSTRSAGSPTRRPESPKRCDADSSSAARG